MDRILRDPVLEFVFSEEAIGSHEMRTVLLHKIESKTTVLTGNEPDEPNLTEFTLKSRKGSPFC